MNELIQAWTRAGLAVAAYFEKQLNSAQPELPLRTPAPAAAAAEPAPEPKPRVRKEKAAAVAATAPLVDPNMTAEQSAKEVYDVATAFVERFKKDSPDGRTMALAILKEKFNAAAIAELKEHAQRVQFIGALKAKMAEADKAAA